MWALRRQKAGVPGTSEVLAALPSLSDPKEPLPAAWVPPLFPVSQRIMNCFKGRRRVWSLPPLTHQLRNIGGFHFRL